MWMSSNVNLYVWCLAERERLEWGLIRWMGSAREVVGEIKSAIKMRAVERRRRRSMRLSKGLTQGVFPQQLREEGWHWCVGIKLDPLVVWGLENIHTCSGAGGVPRVPPPSVTPPPVTHTERMLQCWGPMSTQHPHTPSLLSPSNFPFCFHQSLWGHWEDFHHLFTFCVLHSA